MAFDLRKLLIDVFDPGEGETVVVAADLPHDTIVDTPPWQARRVMAEEWRLAFSALGTERGFATLPLLTFPATGANNSELPAEATLAGRPVSLADEVSKATLAVFMTQFSATAPLDGFCQRKGDFRAVSMPGIEKRMEETALSADYREVARRCRILADILEGADGLDVRFSTGHSCYFDLRFRRSEADDGFLPRLKAGDRVINLPSGETFIVPYEGERPDTPSRTTGILPVGGEGEVVLLHVSANRVVAVEGNGARAQQMRDCFALDAARRNVAEVAFGCNDRAVVTGNVLEDEKAGFHWAFGRSDHLGGTVGVGAFTRREHVMHQDIVYAKGNPIQIAEAVVLRGEKATTVIREGAYLVF
jgi:leucyl aminopeptidase (aminopeptidase T)